MFKMDHLNVIALMVILVKFVIWTPVHPTLVYMRENVKKSARVLIASVKQVFLVPLVLLPHAPIWFQLFSKLQIFDI